MDIAQTGDEIEELAHAFDRTIISLKLAMSRTSPELQKQKDALSNALEEQEKVQKKYENVRRVLDESSLVAVTDLPGDITYVNKKFIEVSKFTEKELLGQNHRIIKSKDFHSQEFYENLWKTIAEGNIWQGDIRNTAKMIAPTGYVRHSCRHSMSMGRSMAIQRCAHRSQISCMIWKMASANRSEERR
ncbi:MAG: PAS domain-containing protein [Rhodobacteraceae bacterium]|nr:PAS domain-containing protein [Paracoccaceae bacterium]